jgi:hypothetical protein
MYPKFRPKLELKQLCHHRSLMSWCIDANRPVVITGATVCVLLSSSNTTRLSFPSKISVRPLICSYFFIHLFARLSCAMLAAKSVRESTGTVILGAIPSQVFLLCCQVPYYNSLYYKIKTIWILHTPSSRSTHWHRSKEKLFGLPSLHIMLRIGSQVSSASVTPVVTLVKRSSS